MGSGQPDRGQHGRRGAGLTVAARGRVLGSTVREGVLFTLHYMRANRFRTFLSLLGVSVGVFTIMAILVTVYTLKATLMKEFAQLGSKSVYVDKWPWVFNGSSVEWWRFRTNRAPDYGDYRALLRAGAGIGEVGMAAQRSGGVLKRERKVMRNVTVCGVMPNSGSLVDLTAGRGRGLSFRELAGESNVCVLGFKVAKQLLGEEDAVGQEIRVDGFRVRVVGVLAEQGNRMLTMSADDAVVVPYGFAAKLYGHRSLYNVVAVTPAKGVTGDALADEVRRALRANRKLSPDKPDNFALNRISALESEMAGLVRSLNMAAVFLGGFSVLIGGFGIVNIMLVSVQERIRTIGIQKALGARSGFILLQFLIESMALSLLGGVMALFFLWLLAVGVSSFTSFDVAMRWWHGALGCGLALAVGLVAGLVPARQAAGLPPVVAIEGLSGAR